MTTVTQAWERQPQCTIMGKGHTWYRMWLVMRNGVCVFRADPCLGVETAQPMHLHDPAMGHFKYWHSDEAR